MQYNQGLALFPRKMGLYSVQQQVLLQAKSKVQLQQVFYPTSAPLWRVQWLDWEVQDI